MQNEETNIMNAQNMNIELSFNSAKVDIIDCFENPLKASDRLTRNWIYSVEPSTMAFVKAYKSVSLDGTHSLYSAFCHIMKLKSL